MGKTKLTLMKYVAGILVLGVILFNSVYVQKLDDAQSSAGPEQFDPKAYALNFWENELPEEAGRAVEAGVLLDLFESDMQLAVEKHARTLGIASLHAYLVKGEGRIVEISDDGLLVSIDDDPDGEVLIVTFDLFGNAIRDASGLVDIADFPGMMEFNTISTEINSIVRTDVAGPALENAEVGKEVLFIGAAEVNENDPAIHPLTLFPIDITWKE